jgi:hypothetical protein
LPCRPLGTTTLSGPSILLAAAARAEAAPEGAFWHVKRLNTIRWAKPYGKKGDTYQLESSSITENWISEEGRAWTGYKKLATRPLNVEAWRRDGSPTEWKAERGDSSISPSEGKMDYGAFSTSPGEGHLGSFKDKMKFLREGGGPHQGSARQTGRRNRVPQPVRPVHPEQVDHRSGHFDGAGLPERRRAEQEHQHRGGAGGRLD